MADHHYISVRDAVRSAIKDRGDKRVGIQVDPNQPNSLDELTTQLTHRRIEYEVFSPEQSPSPSQYYLLDANVIRDQQETTLPPRNGFSTRDLARSAVLHHQQNPLDPITIIYNGSEPKGLYAALTSEGIPFTTIAKESLPPDHKRNGYEIDVSTMNVIE